MAGCRRAFMTVDKDHTGRGNVERQTQDCGEEQNGREGREIERSIHIHAHHQDRQRDDNIQREEDIE